LKKIIKHIDSAIKKLYGLDFSYTADLYLINSRPEKIQKTFANPELQGALYLYSENNDLDDCDIGIYLSSRVKLHLKSFLHWKKNNWSHAQLSAFCIATEEVSHFNYFLNASLQNKKVSQLDLETQGDIDKFLVTYFSNCNARQNNKELFEDLFEKLFQNFKLSEDLDDKKKLRYLKANSEASQFIMSIKPRIILGSLEESCLKIIRKHYNR
jgi:hypothetical protein